MKLSMTHSEHKKVASMGKKTAKVAAHLLSIVKESDQQSQSQDFFERLNIDYKSTATAIKSSEEQNKQAVTVNFDLDKALCERN